jgi:hypothetical protein
MLRRTSSSGEGMQRDRNRDHNVRQFMRAGAIVRRAAVGLVALGLAAGAAQAQTYGSDSGTAWTSLMRSFGLGRSDATADIDYSERAPLVVPPSRDLPAPASAAPSVSNWPRDPAKPAKRAKTKGVVIPDTAVQTPNPPAAAKPWYNPIGWFNKEEYATFVGEPVRKNLTDPPSGYRVPSPDQPYGLGPDKKTGTTKPTSADLGLTPAVPGSK